MNCSSNGKPVLLGVRQLLADHGAARNFALCFFSPRALCSALNEPQQRHSVASRSLFVASRPAPLSKTRARALSALKHSSALALSVRRASLAAHLCSPVRSPVSALSLSCVTPGVRRFPLSLRVSCPRRSVVCGRSTRNVFSRPTKMLPFEAPTIFEQLRASFSRCRAWFKTRRLSSSRTNSSADSTRERGEQPEVLFAKDLAFCYARPT